MKILKISILALGTSLCGLAQADMIGVKADASYWFYDGKAKAKLDTVSLSNHTGTDPILLNPYANLSEPEENLDRKGSAQISLAFEHPIPLIPNAKIRYVNLKSQTEKEVAGQPVYDLNIDHTDFILYYEILDNDLVSLDLGVTAKYIDGDITVAAEGASATQDLSAVIPMGYAYGSFGLLGTGTKIFAEVNYVSYDGSSLSDMQFGIAYELIDTLAVDLALKAGVKKTKLELDDIDNVDADLTFDGAFISAELHF